MRVLASLLLIGATFAQPPAAQPPKPAEPALKPEEKCKVSGQVVSLTTGEAVRRANLKLQPVGAGNEATATSDADGKFEFTGVTPGRYRLNAEKQGFMQQAYGARTGSPGSATPLQLAKGQEMKGLTFKLTPHGIIAGRVLDDEGEPVNMAIMQPLRYVYNRGRRQLVPTMGNASIFTNDQGEYRLSGLQPGKYYVSAMRMAVPGMPGGETTAAAPPSDKPEESLVTTYYPNVLESSSASAVDLGPGAEVRAIDIRMRKSKTVRVKGKVVDAAGLPASGAMISMAKRDAGMTMPFTGPTAMVTTGDFLLTGVVPGLYYATVIVTSGGSGPLITRHRVDVGEDHLEGVVITLSKGWELAGSVKVDGATESVGPAALKSIRAILMPNEGFPMNVAQGQWKDDGTLVFKSVTPDIYRLELTGAPPNQYIKSVRYGTQDVTDAAIDLSAAIAGPIEIVLGADGGSASGTVRTAKGDPVSGAAVTLLPKTQPAVRGDLFRTVYTDQTGRFQMLDIAPGEYKLMAWEELESGAEQDAQFRGAFERYAVDVKVGSSATVTQSLEVISKDAVEAEKAKGK
jgi:protocatechuate 3,4-dioxygenase beta subunit